MSRNEGNFRTYNRKDVIIFRKTKEIFGGLSNMAPGYPLCINGISIRTAEALYQACRFPMHPNIQKNIIEQKSPMTAKMKGKPFRHLTRSDWEKSRVIIMRWCLRVKLVQNWDKFTELLRSTNDIPIVEESRKDDFWGAKPISDETLVGINLLGRLLMELREELKGFNSSIIKNDYILEPPNLDNFFIYGEPIEPIKKIFESKNSIQSLQDQSNEEEETKPEQMKFNF